MLQERPKEIAKKDKKKKVQLNQGVGAKGREAICKNKCSDRVSRSCLIQQLSICLLSSDSVAGTGGRALHAKSPQKCCEERNVWKRDTMKTMQQ